MNRPFARLCTLLTLILALAAGSTSAQRAPRTKQALLPSLTTARTQYAPGTMAVFSGQGYLPSEMVQMVVSFADGAPLGSDHDFWNATADASGRFTTSWLVSTEEGVGSLLSVTAHGGASGTFAGTTFLNNHDCGDGVLAAVTPVGGSCSAFTPAQGNGPDNYEVEEGGTYTMTITGVTECSGDTITIFVQSSSSGNFCFNATGGSGTYSGTFTMPNPACNTMPVSYKCGANATCSHPGSLGLRGPNSACGGVHLRTSNFDANCNKTGTDTDCDAPPATGACCLADGSCVEVTEEECTAQGGTYSGDNSLCSGVNCPQPIGACCMNDGSCVEVTEDDCFAMGGQYQGDDTECATANCPSPAGACCLADGTCVQATEDDCAAQGGTYSGDDSMCKDVTCPQPPGACCLVDGSCVDVTEEDCVALGGYYNGDGSTCANVVCEQPPGACCLADGSCVEVSEQDCLANGGTFYGIFSTCASTTCPQPTGACCLSDDLCVDVTEEDCAAQNGVYFGDGSSCANTNCDDAFPDCFTLGFDTDDDGNAMPHGAKVDLEYDCNGSVFPLTITGAVDFSGQNTAAILDSTNGPAMQDPDLLVGKGNILILQNDANLTQCPANSGVYCSHNDDEHGGTLTFAFCVPASPSSITLIDQDLSDPLGGSVVLTDVNGKTRTYTVPANWTGDRVTDFPQPGWAPLNLTTLANQPGFGSTVTASEQVGFDPAAVVSLTVTFGGSGGIDDLVWCQ